MKISPKLMCAAVVLFTAVGVATGGALKSAHADPPPITLKTAPLAAQQPSCAGEHSFRIEVEHSRDVQLSMSRPAGASGWNTLLFATGRVATLDRNRPCGTATTRVQISADDADARSALQTCATMGAAVASGQKLVLSLRLLDAARAGAGSSSLMLSKPVQIDCGVE